MSTYWINFYPKGQMGNKDEPEIYAYHTDAHPPIGDHGFRLKITVPEAIIVEVVK